MKTATGSLFRIPACMLTGLMVSCAPFASRATASNCNLTQVPNCTWAGGNAGFFAADDAGSVIDFQTLPDGSPSFGGANITPAFNYALQGALFSSPFAGLKVVGNSQLGFALEAYTTNPIAHNYITAQLTNPQRGVGVWVVDHTTLFAFNAQGSLITSVSYSNFDGIEYFLGIKSNVPIARVVIDRGDNIASLDDFTMIHVPVPEPASALLLLIAGPLLLRRTGRNFRVFAS